MSIIDSIVFGIGTLPEAKIGLVKGKAKREMDYCRLHALSRSEISSYIYIFICRHVKQNSRFARLLQGSEGRLRISEGFGRLTTIRRPAKVAKFWDLFKDRDYVPFLCNFLKGGVGRSPLSLNRLWPIALILREIFLNGQGYRLYLGLCFLPVLPELRPLLIYSLLIPETHHFCSIFLG